MTPLRKAMIEAMQVRGFSVRTHASYLSAVTDLACYYHRPPDKLTNEQLQAYFLYLATDRALSGSSCRLYLNAIRFFYLQVLQWSEFAVQLQVPKKAQRIPELLTRNEVTRIILACANGKHWMLLTTCYGCGLRVSEVVALKVRHIDGERHLLRVEPGKGAKDRHVLISQTLLNSLRRYIPARLAAARPSAVDQSIFGQPPRLIQRRICACDCYRPYVSVSMNRWRRKGIA